MELILNSINEVQKSKINALKKELIILIEEHSILVNFTCKNIQADYLRLLGPKKLQLLKLDFERRKLKRKIELIQIYSNSNLKIDNNKIESQIEEELIEWNSKIQDYTYNIILANSTFQITEDEAKEVKKLFRKLSKLLHPDLNTNQSENHKLLWLRVYEAYKCLNLQELKAIESILIFDDADKTKKSKEYEINQTISQLEKQLNRYIKLINEIKSSHPYNLIEITENENNLKEELNLIEIQINNITFQISAYNIIIEGLRGNYGININ